MKFENGNRIMLLRHTQAPESGEIQSVDTKKRVYRIKWDRGITLTNSWEFIDRNCEPEFEL